MAPTWRPLSGSVGRVYACVLTVSVFIRSLFVLYCGLRVVWWPGGGLLFLFPILSVFKSKVGFAADPFLQSCPQGLAARAMRVESVRGWKEAPFVVG